jgi:hypothetical protein
MNSKATTVAMALLTLAFLGGYIAGSLTLQGQLTDLNFEYSNALKENFQLKETINNLRANVTNLNRQISTLESNTGHVFLTTHAAGWLFQGWSALPPKALLEVPMGSGSYN